MIRASRLSLILALVVGACSPTGTSEAPAPSGPPPQPAIAAGQLSPAEEAAGMGLLEEALAAAEDKQWLEAAVAARGVVETYPELSGSSEALRVLARAALESGDLPTARTAAEQVLEMFGTGDDRAEEARLVLGRADLMAGDTLSGIVRLTQIPPGTSNELVAEALGYVRAAVPSLTAPELETILSRAPSPGPVLPPVQVEYGVALYFQGATEEARALGQAALDSGATGQEAGVAQALADGRVEGALGESPTLGALLPSTGPPTLTRYGALLEEGIRIALEEQRTVDRRPVQLLVRDDGGSVSSLERLVPMLEGEGVSAIIGPLLDDAVSAAASMRRREVPIISPTARTLPAGVPGVYSLQGPDPSAPRTLADWAVRSGVLRVVIAHPTEPASTFEAEIFREAFTSAGGEVLRELRFPVGTTYFEDILRQVERLGPDAVVLPLQPADIELIAPQVTFYGLDTLGIQVLGTDGWTSAAVLQDVATRHTDGVVATTALPNGLPNPAARRFREQYESIYRRTLRSEVPAYGYDAARLLLEGIRSGASTAGELRRFLDGLRGFDGATGRLSVEDGMIVRSHTLVRLENRTLFPVFIP